MPHSDDNTTQSTMSPRQINYWSVKFLSLMKISEKIIHLNSRIAEVLEQAL